MNGRLKRRLLLLGALGVVIAAPLAYFLTLGHCFLPLEAFDYRNETIEVRQYEGLYWRAYRESTSITRALQAVRRVEDKIVYSGRVRMDAAIAKVEATGSSSPFEMSGRNSLFQQVLETMGYAFPPGCSAGVDTNYVWRIVHYPSMLKRIEKDLRLKRHSRDLQVRGVVTSPNKRGAGNGAGALSFHVGHLERAVPDHERSAY
jgi:hypothetical protein